MTERNYWIGMLMGMLVVLISPAWAQYGGGQGTRVLFFEIQDALHYSVGRQIELFLARS